MIPVGTLRRWRGAERDVSESPCAPCASEPDEFECNVQNDAPFPLTPAFSPGEREIRNPALGRERSRRLAEDWHAVLPLPWGEGRGEGEGSAREAQVRLSEEKFRELQVWTHLSRREKERATRYLVRFGFPSRPAKGNIF